MAGEVLKMSAAVTVPSTSARTVAGPPPSLIATKLSGLMSRPYFGLEPGQPLGAVRNSDGAPNLHLRGMRRQVADGLEVPLLCGGFGDGDGVGVVGR